MQTILIESGKVMLVDEVLPKLDRVLHLLSVQRCEDKDVKQERAGTGSKIFVPLISPLGRTALDLTLKELPNARVSIFES
jgi:hypothetical protein